MKKMNTKKAMRFSAVMASALMAASAAGMAVSADSADVIDAIDSGNVITSVKKTTKSVPAGEASISLVGQNAKPGESVEVAMVVNAKDQCTCYDVLVEFDARLELEQVTGAKASCEFEEDGRKFVSLVGYEVTAYTDGTSVAVMKFRVPEDAENDDYIVKFDQVKVFSDDYADFEDYKTNNTCVTVTGGTAKKGTGLTLKSVVGLAGGNAVVQVVPTTGNRCECYDMLIEYDSRLLLEGCDVALANSFDIFEADGKSYVSLVGYTTDVYHDDEPMAALNFHLPYDAAPDDSFEVKVAQVKTFANTLGEFDDYYTVNGAVSVMDLGEDAMVRSADGTMTVAPKSKVKVFQKFAPNGALIGTQIGYRGDFNGDGSVSTRDCAKGAYLLASKGRAFADEIAEFFGDVNNDGKYDARDIAATARFLANGCRSW